MNELIFFIVLVFVVTWVALVISLAVDGNRLFYSFRRKYPEESMKKMKQVFTGFRHPSKAIYFLTKDSKDFLIAANDSSLLALRNRVARMTWGLLILHFGFIALGFVFIAFTKLRGGL